MHSRSLPSYILLSLGIVFVLVLAVADGTVRTGVQAQTADSDFVPGQLIVRFDDDWVPGSQARVAGVEGASVKQSTANGALTLISVPVGAEDEYATRLSALPGVASVEQNTLQQLAFIPDDELFPLQWNMPMIQALSAWNQTLGEGAIVAVLDTGIAFEDWNNGQFLKAPDLAETAFVHPYNAVYDDNHPNDDHGHGTHVTGTIAQDTNNSIGVAGVAPEAAIMPVKVCVFIGCPAFAIASGIIWAVDHGADVINMSLGGSDISDAERQALQYAEDNGVFTVAAAGNGGPDQKGDPFLDYPAAVDSVFSVGAVRFSLDKTSYSNYGEGDTAGLDIVAPGGQLNIDENGDGYPDGVLQNTYEFICGGVSGNYTAFDYCFYQGTSMATPHVAGTAALLLSEYPDLTPAQVREVLRCSAKDIGDPGYDPIFGYGLIQAADAIRDSDGDGIVDCLDATPQALPPYVSIESAAVTSGGEVTISLDANVDPPGLAAFAINVEFDPAVVEPVDCEVPGFAICNLDYGRASILGQDETVRLTGALLDPVVGHITLADITFRAVAPGLASTLLTIELDEFANDDLVDLTSATVVQNGEIIVESGSQLSGDANCDGSVDSLDVLSILQSSAGIAEPDCHDTGDVDCDGDVDAVDALEVAQYIAGIPFSLPPGCPGIGAVI